MNTFEKIAAITERQEKEKSVRVQAESRFINQYETRIKALTTELIVNRIITILALGYAASRIVW